MDKGVSGLVVALLLLVVSVALAGGFYTWGQYVADDFKQSTSDDVERGLNDLNSNIAVTNVVVGASTQITVKNTGKTQLDTSLFNVFADGALVSHSANPTGFIAPGQTVVLMVGQNLSGKTVRVAGQYGTADELVV